MIRGISALAIATLLLAGCGGGGGSKGGFTPTVPTGPSSSNKSPGTVKFSFKIPNQTTMSRVKRPYYASQATAGIGFNWTSTIISSPDYSAAISATCPSPTSYPPGVIGCTVSSTGTVYTFQLEMLPATYSNIIVSTYDKAPSSGSFIGANMLAQGNVGASITIQPGSTNTLPSMTFWGVPATVSITPGAGQSHIQSTLGGYDVIGNTPVTFYVQALDADGFAISSSAANGGPTLSLAESDTGGYFSTPVQNATNPFAFTLHAVTVPPTLATSATLQATATQSNVTPPVAPTGTIAVAAAPELWITYTNGTTGSIYGFALTSGVDFGLQYAPVDAISTSYSPGVLAVDNNGNVWVTNGTTNQVQLYTAGSNSNPPAIAASTTIQGVSIVALAVDANNNLWLADSTANQVVAYNINSPASPTAESYNTISGGTPASMTNPAAMTIAPTNTAIYPQLRNTLWIESGGGIVDVFTPGTSASSPVAELSGGDSVITGAAYTAMAIDPTGSFWYFSGGTIYGINAALASSSWPTNVTAAGTTGIAPYLPGSQLAAYPEGIYFNSYYGPENSAFSGCPACSVVSNSNGTYGASNTAPGAYISP